MEDDELQQMLYEFGKYLHSRFGGLEIQVQLLRESFTGGPDVSLVKELMHQLTCLEGRVDRMNCLLDLLNRRPSTDDLSCRLRAVEKEVLGSE